MALPDRSIRGIFRRDYKYMDNPLLKSYLIGDSIDNSPTNNANLGAGANANNTVDANIDPALLNTEALDGLDAVDALINSQDDSDVDDSLQSQSIDLFDSVSQTLSARYTKRAYQIPRAWCYKFFEIQLLDGVFYTPKGTTSIKPERRYWCKRCTWSVLESKKDSTGNLISHLAKQHYIGKHSVPKGSRTVVDLLKDSAKPSVQLLSPEDSVIDWIVDSFTPFTGVEQASFQRMFEAYGNKCSICNADTIHDRVIERYINSIAALKAQLE
jgi:hypothetical protein